MTVLRAFDEKEKYDYSVIVIEDEGLRVLLLHALSHHPDFGHPGTLSFASLFEPIIHNWALLNDLADDNRNESSVINLRKELDSAYSSSMLAPLRSAGSLARAQADLKALLQQVRDTPGLESYFNGQREMQENANTVFFDYLWTIFPPGELVFSRTFLGQPQVFIVKSSTDFIQTRRRSERRSWSLECWSYDWNGTIFNRVPVSFTFEHFKGTRSISSLHCYPLHYHRGGSDDDGSNGGLGSEQTMKQALIQRGMKYRELCTMNRGKQIFEYDGFAFSRGTGVRKVAKSNQVSIVNNSRNSLIDYFTGRRPGLVVFRRSELSLGAVGTDTS